MAHYPVFLDLKKRSCVVIGGCGMAEEKVKALLAAGADVTVVASDLAPGLGEMARDSRITWIDRGYHRGDLRRAFLAIVVSQSARVVDAAWEEGRERKVLVNTLDDVPHCHFIAPAVVQRGDLSIAISTGGKAPVLAVRLRERLEGEVGPEHARFLEIAGTLRAPLARRWPDFETRRALWYRLVDSDVLHLLRQGEETQAFARIEEILSIRPEAIPSPAAMELAVE